MPGELPVGICAVTDRHGKRRWRFRMAGRWPCYISGQPGTDDFMRQYEAARHDVMPDAEAQARRTRDRTLVRQAKERQVHAVIAGATKGSWIYVIGAGRGPVKIGWTTNLKSRLVKLQTGSPVKLRLLALAPGNRADEARLHHLFAADRLTGEWFNRSSAVAQFMQQNRPRLSNLNLTNLTNEAASI